MIRKLAIGVATAAAMIGAASTANAGVDFNIGIGVPGYYGPGYYGPGYYGGGYYGAYYAPPPPPAYYGGGYYGGCRNVVVGYRNKKVWRGDGYVWRKRPVYRTVCN